MRKKLHISVLFFSLVFVVTYLSKTDLPNQQILVQLSQINSSNLETNQALEKIKGTLQAHGAKSLSVTKLQDGQLKITYFSTSDVYDIQKVLSKEVGFNFMIGEGLPNSELPDNNPQNDFLLQISELSPDSNNSWGFESTEILTSQIKADRFIKVKYKFYDSHFLPEMNNSLALKKKLIFGLYQNIKQSSYYIFPEVRAGPIA